MNPKSHPLPVEFKDFPQLSPEALEICHKSPLVRAAFTLAKSGTESVSVVQELMAIPGPRSNPSKTE